MGARCECPDPAMDHAAGCCPGMMRLRQYRRDGRVLWLCWNCERRGDVALPKRVRTRIHGIG